jgi:aspartate dehydrogenase
LSKQRLGLIGYGAIGQQIVSRMRDEGRLDELVAILVRPTAIIEDTSLPFCSSLDEFLKLRPEMVMEAAGHQAVTEMGPALLKAGVDFAISSIGALAHDECFAAMAVASRNGGRLLLTAGAMAGFDGLVAASIAGIDAVCYTSAKPPKAWLGTPAEQAIDLDHTEDEIVFFDGSARNAAVNYPKNANISAAVAFAGIGLERTRVKLVSSRLLEHPKGIVEASGEFGTFRFEVFAYAFPENPKSSILTAFALLQTARYGIGIPFDPS